MHTRYFTLPLAALGLACALPAHAAITLAPPTSFSAGPLGTLSAQGILSAAGTWQGQPYPGNHSTRLDVTNAQMILQKSSGLVQFYVQAGAYNFPTLGEPIQRTASLVANTYGVVPEAYLTIAPSKGFSVEVGKLPTLVGTEMTWTWQNQNIERGLLWNDENAVNRGVQVNLSHGPLALSLSVNDGFYSQRYDVLTGLATYTIDRANTASFSWYHRFGHSAVNTFVTPVVLDNADIYDLMYTHTSGPWTISPYLQYIVSPKAASLGFTKTEHAGGAAIIADYQMTRMVSLAGRAEYETSSGANSTTSANSNILGFGPGSKAWSLTVTPTYQDHGFFTRVELSYVHVTNATAGDVFGAAGNRANQVRAMLETGVTF